MSLRSVFGGQATTKDQIARCYQKPRSISEQLPWMEYSDTEQCFLLDDGESVAGILRCDDVASEGRPMHLLQQLQMGLQGVFQDVFPMYFDQESPWVIQFFLQDEMSLASDYQRYLDYIECDVKDSQISDDYQSLLKEHLHYLSRAGGVFVDEKVSGLPFAGKKRRIHCVVYRRLGKKSKRFPGRSAAADLNIVMNSLTSKLEGNGVKTTRVDGEGFYRWLLPWFNPKPRQTSGSAEALLKKMAYPNKDNRPFGYDFSEKLFFNTPESDVKKGIWLFDGMPHKYLSITGLNAVPELGALSLERQFGNHFYSVFDQMPEGSVFQFTVVLQSQEQVKNKIDGIERSTRKATSTEGFMAREDCETARRAIASNNFIFPTSMGVYLKADNYQALVEKETQVMTLLSNNRFITVSGESELTPVDSYLRYLPMCYEYGFDRNYLSRSRYLTGKQLSALLPLYGRERGTGHPGLLFYNRLGETLTVDPFNPKDKDFNSHLLMLGSTGSGKSALCCYLMMHLMATYKPRLVIVDAGNSFALLGQYFESVGLSVNRVEIGLQTQTSLNPFADSRKLLEQIDVIDEQKLQNILRESDKERQTASEAATDQDKNQTSDSRDYMGEMALACQLMITGGEVKEEAKITRQDRLYILEALVKAAKKAEANGQAQMLPIDIASAFEKMAKTLQQSEQRAEQQKAARLIEMSDGIKIFCKDNLSSRFFNREGEPWPEADVTILEMGLFKDEGYDAQRALTFMGAMNKTLSFAETHQYDKRFTVFFGDECHVVTKNPLTAVSVTKCAKMSRKLGLWLWLATQNVEDFPNEARKMLSMMEFWICLGMSEAELSEVQRFKKLTDEERSLFRSVRKSAGQYVEGVLLCQRFKGLFRNIPPRLALSLAMTEKSEKAERQKIMKEENCSEIKAAKIIAERMVSTLNQEASSNDQSTDTIL